MSSTEGQLSARFDRTVRHLEHWGDVFADDSGAGRGHRVLEYELHVPGDGQLPEARALFREYYRRDDSSQWWLAKYTYEYFDLFRFWRLGYHLHPLGGSGPIPHAHCDPDAAPITDEGTRHYRATEYDLREANAAFMRLYAAGRPPDCETLLPLEIGRR